MNNVGVSNLLCAPGLLDIIEEDAIIFEAEGVHDVVLVCNEDEGGEDDVDTKFEIMNEVKVGLGLITFGRIMFAESVVSSDAVRLLV